MALAGRISAAGSFGLRSLSILFEPSKPDDIGDPKNMRMKHLNVSANRTNHNYAWESRSKNERPGWGDGLYQTKIATERPTPISAAGT